MSQDRIRPESDGADPNTLLRSKHRTALGGLVVAMSGGLAMIAIAEGRPGTLLLVGLTTLLCAASIGVYAGTLDIARTALRSIGVQHDEQDRATAILADRLDAVEQRERQTAARLGDLFDNDLSRRRSG